MGCVVKRLTGTLMVGAAVASNAAFLALGELFAYPQILRAPTAEILARFNADRPAIIAWFLVLTAAAACLIPVAAMLRDWHRALGVVAAVSVLAGVLEPAGVEIAGLLNFAGYLLWSGWLVWAGISLWRKD